MGIVFFLASIAVFLAGGVVSALCRRAPRASRLTASASAALGGLLALAAGLAVLIGVSGAASGRPAGLSLPWSFPYGSFRLEIDGLSAFFLLPVGIVTALAGIYAAPYRRLQEEAGEHADGHAVSDAGGSTAGDPPGGSPGHPGSLQGLWYNGLAAGMLLVLAARNGVLFLIAWELMSLSSFFLVMTHGEKESTQRAGWNYLMATHLGMAFLLVLFLLLGRGQPTLDFSAFLAGTRSGGAPGAPFGAPPGVLFLLALIGFGTKAGFVPLHVWLPDAHPAAPSPVSAVMSGVMIKTGIYGLLRVLTFLGAPEPWWGWTLLAVGAVSGLLGVLHALAQHDLKRLLAYHSVENIGIIALGLGLGLLGLSYRLPLLAALGFAGGLLHVLNHALFKSLLFLGAGAVDCAAGTRELERLGGLLKRMPLTGAAFLLGAAAISGLPPLNGFVSEFLIYLGAFRGLLADAAVLPVLTVAGLVAIGSLALIGGLAAACFAKAFGVAFLGEPRSEAATRVRSEVPRGMWLPMLVLAGLCLAVGLAAPLVLAGVAPAVAALTGAAAATVGLRAAAASLVSVSVAAAVLLALVLLVALARRLALRGKPVREEVTWDCGYAAPTARMQYTASSFAHGITGTFQPLLRSERRMHPPAGWFPASGSLHTGPRDPFLHDLFRPLFQAVSRAAGRMRWLQQGRIQLYVLYIALTILVLLVWKLG